MSGRTFQENTLGEEVFQQRNPNRQLPSVQSSSRSCPPHLRNKHSDLNLEQEQQQQQNQQQQLGLVQCPSVSLLDKFSRYRKMMKLQQSILPHHLQRSDTFSEIILESSVVVGGVGQMLMLPWNESDIDIKNNFWIHCYPPVIQTLIDHRRARQSRQQTRGDHAITTTTCTGSVPVHDRTSLFNGWKEQQQRLRRDHKTQHKIHRQDSTCHMANLPTYAKHRFLSSANAIMEHYVHENKNDSLLTAIVIGNRDRGARQHELGHHSAECQSHSIQDTPFQVSLSTNQRLPSTLIWYEEQSEESATTTSNDSTLSEQSSSSIEKLESLLPGDAISNLKKEVETSEGHNHLMWQFMKGNLNHGVPREMWCEQTDYDSNMYHPVAISNETQRMCLRRLSPVVGGLTTTCTYYHGVGGLDNISNDHSYYNHRPATEVCMNDYSQQQHQQRCYHEKPLIQSSTTVQHPSITCRMNMIDMLLPSFLSNNTTTTTTTTSRMKEEDYSILDLFATSGLFYDGWNLDDGKWTDPDGFISLSQKQRTKFHDWKRITNLEYSSNQTSTTCVHQYVVAEKPKSR